MAKPKQASANRKAATHKSPKASGDSKAAVAHKSAPHKKAASHKKPPVSKTAQRKAGDAKLSPVKNLKKNDPARKKAATRPSHSPQQRLGRKKNGPVNMEASRAALKLVLKTLDDGQADQIVTIDLVGKHSMIDYMIVASGRSSRQVAALAENLRLALTKSGVRPVRVEGMPQADWVLVDGGDVIVHLFRPEVRAFYNLEKMWLADSDLASQENLMVR